MKKDYFEQVQKIVAGMSDEEFINLLIESGLDVERAEDQYDTTAHLEWNHTELRKKKKKAYNYSKYADDAYVSYNTEKGVA